MKIAPSLRKLGAAKSIRAGFATAADTSACVASIRRDNESTASTHWSRSGRSPAPPRLGIPTVGVSCSSGETAGVERRYRHSLRYLFRVGGIPRLYTRVCDKVQTPGPRRKYGRITPVASWKGRLGGAGVVLGWVGGGGSGELISPGAGRSQARGVSVPMRPGLRFSNYSPISTRASPAPPDLPPASRVANSPLRATRECAAVALTFG